MKRILIIEDNQVVANVYRSTLAREGYAVDIRHDGEAGLDAVRQLHPDLVLLDLMLPKTDGLTVLKEIRKTPETREMPVIVSSNSYTPQRMDDVWQLGATHVLTKANSTPKEIVRLVHDALTKAG